MKIFCAQLKVSIAALYLCDKYNVLITITPGGLLVLFYLKLKNLLIGAHLEVDIVILIILYRLKK